MTTHQANGFSSRAAFVAALALCALLAGCSGGPRRVLLNQTAATLGTHKMTIKPVGRWNSNIFGGEQQDTDGKPMNPKLMEEYGAAGTGASLPNRRR